MKLIVCSLLRSGTALLYFLIFYCASRKFYANELVRINAFSRDDAIHHPHVLSLLMPPVISPLTCASRINFSS